ncbi:MAG: transcriptional repressor [Clostridiales bacterium]|nr:transcriptional repressor [Clostridiales bacterium]
MSTRETKQKEAVLQCVHAMGGHPSADDVYAAIVEQLPNISRATVYRNLQVLAAREVLRSVELPHQPTRYEPFTPIHYHFYCRACGCVLNILDEMPNFPEILDKELSKRTGLRVERHRLSFGGLCTECVREEEKEQVIMQNAENLHSANMR